MLNEVNTKAIQFAIQYTLTHDKTLTDDEKNVLRSGRDLFEQLVNGDTIASLWSVEDVQEAANQEHGYDDEDEEVPSHLVDEATARRVLKLCESEHDAEQGINWETIKHWLDYVEGGE